MTERIFVTGATGVVGERAIPMLAAAGHTVTAIGRSPEKRTTLEKLGARAVELDIFDRAAAQRALEGHGLVINLATHMPPSTFKMMLPWQWRENDRVRREGSAALVDAALAAGADSFRNPSRRCTRATAIAGSMGRIRSRRRNARRGERVLVGGVARGRGAGGLARPLRRRRRVQRLR